MGDGLRRAVPGLADRMDRIVGSATVAVSNRAKQLRAEGVDVVALSLGEPDFDSPPHVVDAAKAALDAGHTHYTAGPGIPELRAAVADTASREQGLACGPENVLVSPAKQAVMMAIMATAGRGDEVLMPDPAWVSYAPIAAWAEAKAVPVPLGAGFGVDPDAVQAAITKNTKAVLLNSPSNPTGGVDDPDAVRAVVDLAEDHDLWIISDEIYRHILYEGKVVSPGSLAFDRTITIDGVSKAYAMTGWRIGWAIAPKPAFDAMNRLQGHSVTHCTSFAQHGAVAALTGSQEPVKDMVRAFRERRQLVLDRLNAMDGVEVAAPRGAFYVFPKIQGAEDDVAFATRLLEEAHVATTPGSAFGDAGKGHLRLSYAASEARLTTAMDRLEAFLA